MRQHGEPIISRFRGEFEGRDASDEGPGRFRPLADIPNVALDHLLRPDKVNVTDKLNLDFPSRFGAEREVFVADILIGLQRFERSLVRRDVFELAISQSSRPIMLSKG